MALWPVICRVLGLAPSPNRLSRVWVGPKRCATKRDRCGLLDFCWMFDFYMAVLGVGRCPVGFVASLIFKMPDSQPDSSNMGPVPIDVHEFPTFSESCHGFLTWYLSCFGTCRRKIAFSSFPVGTTKNRDKKLRRFVMVSPREVPSLPISYPFKMLMFRHFLKTALLFLSLSSRKSVY